MLKNVVRKNTGFQPGIWYGEPKEFPHHDIYSWVSDLPNNKNIFCCFWANWSLTADLPKGYDYYIISYEIENVHAEWLKQQQEKTQARFIVLHPGRNYNLHIKNVEFITYTRLHHHLNKMIEWWGIREVEQIKKYKFSVICNRITQSKLWITTKLLEVARKDSFIILNSWLELKNVHNWQLTGNVALDNLTQIYLDKYSTLELRDDFDPADNVQNKNSNPYQPAYTDCAVHFVAGSFHYSEMNDFIYPGPDIDEKTLKCLLAGVAFVPCAQFETLKFLQDLGLEFDYEFDTSWDSDPGNLTRFEKICKLVDDLNQYSAEELVKKTQQSTEHNQRFIIDQKFFANCEKLNNNSVEKLFSLLT